MFLSVLLNFVGWVEMVCDHRGWCELGSNKRARLKEVINIELRWKRGTYLPTVSAPMASEDLEILAHRSLTMALSFSFKLMSAQFSRTHLIRGFELVLKSSVLLGHTQGNRCQAASTDADRALLHPLIGAQWSGASWEWSISCIHGRLSWQELRSSHVFRCPWMTVSIFLYFRELCLKLMHLLLI